VSQGVTASTGLEIAIIGMAGRFPGAPDLDSFWRNLREGVETIRFFTADELTAAGVHPELLRRPNYVPAVPRLDDVESFDAHFFGFSAREAELLDPQHRLFLECSWQALEDSGYAAEKHGKGIGVYAGSSVNSYLTNLRGSLSQADSAGRLQTLLGNDKDYLATRVSYKLGLEGPSLAVQTACSTSLVAVHLACQGLLSGECDLALAGGVSVRVPQKNGYLYAEGEIFSPDGHCRTFDAAARGTVFGSGVGVVVLKRLAEAVRDGDHVRAVIKGSAVNNDGAVKVGYTAPRAETQARVIRAAQQAAGVDAAAISYVEAHGTATPLGDPIEVAALRKAFGAAGGKRSFCALGSVKTNLGHLETAAGIAGLIKTVLALEHRELPPSLHFNEANPAIDFAGSPFYVNVRLAGWPAGDGPRRAGVSSFGIGGTNAHVVLEEAPDPSPASPSRSWQLLLLSAKTPAALAGVGRNLSRHLQGCAEGELPDVAFSLHAGRRDFEHRQIVVCEDAARAALALAGGDPGRIEAATVTPAERPLAFLFPGQGAQYAGMTRALYREEPVFREQIDLCAERLLPHLGLDLRTVLYPAPDRMEEAALRLQETALTQPALFAVEHALAKLWMSWGFQPGGMLGHSLGEYVAACLAGVFSLDDALALVAARGRLMQELPPGAMTSVPLAEEELRPLLDRDLAIAAVNGPALCVVSGVTTAITALEGDLRERGFECRRLRTSHAFHSRMMDPVLEAFSRKVRKVRLSPPRLPFLSNLSGTWITAEEAADPDYWVRHLRRTVRFADGLTRLFEETAGILLEVGPGTTLATLARRHPGRTRQLVLSSLPQESGSQDELPCLLTAVGRLWLAGLPLDADLFYARESRRRVPLPAYPFERERYWIDPQPAAAAVSAPLAERADPADWLYLPTWKRAPWLSRPLRAAAPPGGWLILRDESDETGLAGALTARLIAEGADVVTAQAGAAFARTDSGYVVRPHSPEDYEAMLAALHAAGRSPARIVHLWNVAAALDAGHAVERSFFSLLYLAQALGRLRRDSPLTIAVVSRGAQEVTGEEALEPEKATLLGPCRVIPQEMEGIDCRSIDLPARAGDAQILAERLLGEIEAQAPERAVAYRGSHRWVQTFEAVPPAASPALEDFLCPGSVVLITGGLGGVGLALARYLASAGRVRLTLVGRSRLPGRDAWPAWLAAHGESDPVSRKLQAIRELEELGAEVLPLTADVTDAAALKAAVDAACAHFGEVHGVIHAAGLPGGGLLQLRSAADAERVLAPKVRGARALEGALAGRRLDFLVLCSSTIAVTGGIGQVDYCAANNFLDAFAADYAQRHGTFALAIDWDRWRDAGMAVDAERRSGRAAHPWLGDRVEDAPGRRVYESRLSAERDWLLDEHRVLGTPVVPGTALLEIARAAAEDRTGIATIELREVAFLTPLAVRAGEVRVRTVLTGGGERFEFSIRSCTEDGAAWREHAVGTVLCRDSGLPANRSVPVIESRCPLLAPPDPAGAARLVQWGPRWGSLRRVGWSHGEGLALLELPQEFTGDLASFTLHPALLDVATSFLLAAVAPGSYLPFAYRSLRVHAPLPARVYSHALLRPDEGAAGGEILAFDIAILDEDGVELVEIEGFTMRRLDEPAAGREMRESAAEHPAHAVADALPQAAHETAGGRGIGSAQGGEILGRLLAHRLGSRVVVSTRDLNAVLAQKMSGPERSALPGGAATPLEARELHPRPPLQASYVAPRTPEELILARLWRDLLGIDPIGVHDNFFELGGDSILGIQLFSRARQEGIELTTHQLFTYQTIAELAQVAARVEEEAGAPAAEPEALELSDVRLAAGELEELMARFSDKVSE
jgi:phthiocerol/phenolphthiocerol synthesis type-I polyketide synthase E